MQKTFLFYDIETTGLSKTFDQVLQFAAIRTDTSLKEIERYELKIKLNADVIPAPAAIITHGLGVNTFHEGISEYEAILQIHRWLNQPGTISLGYNTLGFDDEFLRFSFYRHLLKPYSHQYANGCGRMDLYPMIVMFYLFKSHILNWPDVDGKLSLKLEQLNTCNQLAQGKAHDAMIDVEVTLALARRLMTESEMWHYLQGYFQKETDLARMQPLLKDKALLIQGRIGAGAAFQCPVLFLGQHRHYRNQTVWLRLDTDTLQHVTPETIQEQTWSFHKKPAEPNFILPMSQRFLSHLNPSRLEQATQNQLWLSANPKIEQAIKEWHLNYKYPVYPTADSNARLYIDGFWSRKEEIFCEQFHKATPKEKSHLTENAPHQTLYTLATRILGHFFPEDMSPSVREYFEEDRHNRLSHETIDHQGNKKLTAKAALIEIQSLREMKQLDSTALQLLDQYEIYLKK